MGQSVAHGALLNNYPYNTLALSYNFFIWDFNWEGHMLWKEVEGRESHDRTLFHKLTGSHVAYGTHIWPHSFWVEQSFVRFKVKIFLRLSPFSALLLIANQDGNRTSTVSSMLQKTAHVAYGIKTSLNQNYEQFIQ